MLLEEKVELLVRGYVEYTADGKYSVGIKDKEDPLYKEFTLDEGYYMFGYDEEGNILEAEKTDNMDLTGYEVELEYGDIECWFKDDRGVLVINKEGI